nr:hypothetical protein [Tanacetum cinerariifolium]
CILLCYTYNKVDSLPKVHEDDCFHYITEHFDISRRVYDNYHRVQNDDLVKNISNSRKNKDGGGMKILDWMLKEEMKLTDHYKMTTSAPRTPKPKVTKGKSSAQCKQMNVAIVKEHMVDEELDQLLEVTENVKWMHLWMMFLTVKKISTLVWKPEGG